MNPDNLSENLPESLSETLTQEAAAIPVGPPPLVEMHRSARRHQRRRYVGGLAVAAAAAVTIGAVVWWPGGSGAGDGAPIATDVTSSQTSVDVPPAGMRWVGIGSAAVAVPESWGTNDLRCGTPTGDTAVVDIGAVELCLVPYPAETSSVAVRASYDGEDMEGWVPVEVDGEPALQSPQIEETAAGGPKLHRTSVYLVERDVVFEAESTVSQDVVDQTLGSITILDELIAVPGFQQVALDDQYDSRESYVALLEQAGFAVEVVSEQRGGMQPGYVLGASPEPGAVVEPGSAVTVTVSG